LCDPTLLYNNKFRNLVGTNRPIWKTLIFVAELHNCIIFGPLLSQIDRETVVLCVDICYGNSCFNVCCVNCSTALLVFLADLYVDKFEMKVESLCISALVNLFVARTCMYGQEDVALNSFITQLKRLL